MVILALLSTGCMAQDQSAPPALEDRAATKVTATPTFSFHSSFWVNLHDFLYQHAQERGNPDNITTCLETRPEAEQRGWEATLAYYLEDMGSRHHRTDSLMATLRYQMAALPVQLVEGDELQAHYQRLEAAAPAYQACMWDAHDQRNRAWIAAVLPLLEAHETVLRERLTGFYQDPWPSEPIPVDVVSYASWAGANTVIDPSHMMMSSANEEYQGYYSLEMLFHEGSHAVVKPSQCTIADHLSEASQAHDKDIPRGLWHVILFYTTGMTTQEQLRSEAGVEDFVPYMYERGLFDGSWSGYRQAIETHWQAYLDQEIDLSTAATSVIDTIFEGE